MWIEGTGVIQYDPPRGKMKNRTHWWCVINIDKEITRYYRWWVQKELHVKGLYPPAWDAHISVIRGEKPSPENMHLWKKYDGEHVTFRYEHNPQSAPKREHRMDEEGGFWTIDVDCPKGIEIRKEFGFKSNWSLHLTFGRTLY